MSNENSKNTTWFPYDIEVGNSEFNMYSSRTLKQYIPLEKAEKSWNICVCLPHVKDSYWHSVNYGIVSESQRLGVKMQLVEAGGYANLNKQISQIKDFIANGANAIVIGAISFDGLNQVIREAKEKGIPVIDIVNDVSSTDISAKSMVYFGEMGYKIGQYLAERHPKGSKIVKVGWFPGPAGADWAQAADKGFLDAIYGSDSAVRIVETKFGDTSKDTQSRLVEETIEFHPDLKYIVGTAVTAEASYDLLRSRNLTKDIKIMSYYYTSGVHKGIQRGQILAATTDSVVIQGRVAIDQAIRILEDKSYDKHVGPTLFVIDENNINQVDRTAILSPIDFKPIYNI
ncbi:TMAO reductase system periplasmic protein TorT [Moritella sp.]|uniref:TMAO reductase system periplasmic protein TorT n=1 Tax=Moritella sp. TaxID=78556 RepID=UPI001E115F12|nr:TMAO reductase system periplasmic protein TorT [Moritella sp.]MCJ8351208.1 TMAO reductase system periplasmic protein TorT [Moritella sp.]NQZ41491.1 TMAO reductase system periplasmic protein TorT [Moritella sp.]